MRFCGLTVLSATKPLLDLAGPCGLHQLSPFILRLFSVWKVWADSEHLCLMLRATIPCSTVSDAVLIPRMCIAYVFFSDISIVAASLEPVASDDLRIEASADASFSRPTLSTNSSFEVVRLIMCAPPMSCTAAAESAPLRQMADES